MNPRFAKRLRLQASLGGYTLTVCLRAPLIIATDHLRQGKPIRFKSKGGSNVFSVTDATQLRRDANTDRKTRLIKGFGRKALLTIYGHDAF